MSAKGYKPFLNRMFRILKVLYDIEHGRIRDEKGEVIRKAYIALIQKLLGESRYQTVSNVIEALRDAGLVELEPEGNVVVVRLTDRGRCIARCLATE